MPDRTLMGKVTPDISPKYRVMSWPGKEDRGGGSDAHAAFFWPIWARIATDARYAFLKIRDAGTRWPLGAHLRGPKLSAAK
eukprot:scaffold1609_cov252-Pinguiococcus_pyrenoidosus.AAC.4